MRGHSAVRIAASVKSGTGEDSLLNGAHEDEAGMRKKKRGDWQKCVTLTMAVKARVREITRS